MVVIGIIFDRLGRDHLDGYFGDLHISLQAVPRDNMRRVRAEKGRAIH